MISSSSESEEQEEAEEDDDCIVISEDEPSEEEEDTGNSGMHTNDLYNVPDEQGRVLINVGHAENEEDVFLAPQIARIIKPHQVNWYAALKLNSKQLWKKYSHFFKFYRSVVYDSYLTILSNRWNVIERRKDSVVY